MGDDGKVAVFSQVSDLCTIVHSLPGRLRLRLTEPGSADRLDALRSALLRSRGVRDVRLNRQTLGLILDYEPDHVDEQRLMSLPVSNGAIQGPSLTESVEASATIDADVDTIWRILNEGSLLPVLTGGAVEVQEQQDSENWTVTIALPGHRARGHVRVTERRPNEKLVLELSGRFIARLTVELEPGDDGVFVFEWLEFARPANPIRRLPGTTMVGPQLRARLEASLRSIRELAEADVQNPTR